MNTAWFVTCLGMLLMYHPSASLWNETKPMLETSFKWPKSGNSARFFETQPLVRKSPTLKRKGGIKEDHKQQNREPPFDEFSETQNISHRNDWLMVLYPSPSEDLINSSTKSSTKMADPENLKDLEENRLGISPGDGTAAINFSAINKTGVSMLHLSRSNLTSEHPSPQKQHKSVDALKMEIETAVCEHKLSSCENLCGARSTKWSSFRCGCDVYCQIYGTCCEDFRTVCPEIWQESHSKFSYLMNVKIECLRRNSVGYLVIASCSDYFNLPSSDTIRHNCEDTLLEDPFSVENFHFKNMDCLRCNGFNESEAKLWNLKVRLNTNYKLNWASGPGFIHDFKSHIGSESWISPEPNSKHCRSTIIDTCPNGTEPKLKKKCEGWRFYVVAESESGETIYGNKYCARCNNEMHTNCRNVLMNDFEPDMNSGLSSLFTWQPLDNGEKGGVILSDRRMHWKKLECTGDFLDHSTLNCSVKECYDYILLVNGICSTDNRKVCHTIGIDYRNLSSMYDTANATNTNLTMLTWTITDILESYIKAYRLVEFSKTVNETSIQYEVRTVRADNEMISWEDENSRIGYDLKRNLSKNGYIGQFSLCFESLDNACRMTSCHLSLYEIPDTLGVSPVYSGCYGYARASWYLFVIYLVHLD